MSHRRIHFWEKLQVQVATAATLAVVYFLLWRLVRPWDPAGPVSFVSTGSYGALATLAGVAWVLAAGCALLTILSRPEGALLATLIGAAGVSMRSPQIRGLLWEQTDSFARMYAAMIGETLILAVVVAGVAGIVLLVRRAAGAARPRWRWRGPLERLGEAQRQAALSSPKWDWWIGGFEASVLEALAARIAGRTQRDPLPAGYNRKVLARSAGCLLLSLLVGATLCLILIRSPQRGQILFGVFAGMMLAVLIAHQVLPTPYSIVALATPICLAVILYVLAAASATEVTALSWIRLPLYARALPVDWATAGCGGAVLGYWLSARMHENRLIQQLEDAKPQS